MNKYKYNYSKCCNSVDIRLISSFYLTECFQILTIRHNVISQLLFVTILFSSNTLLSLLVFSSSRHCCVTFPVHFHPHFVQLTNATVNLVTCIRPVRLSDALLPSSQPVYPPTTTEIVFVTLL